MEPYFLLLTQNHIVETGLGTAEIEEVLGVLADSSADDSFKTKLRESDLSLEVQFSE